MEPGAIERAWVRCQTGILLLLIAVPWLVAGGRILRVSGQVWSIYRDSANWTETAARIDRVEWKVERSSEKGKPTYGVEADYTYEFDGHAYTGHRVGVLDVAGSDEGFRRQRFDLLESHRQSGRPVAALVDPNRPSRAVLFREVEPSFRLFLGFGVGLCFVGLLIAGFGVGLLWRSRSAVLDERRLVWLDCRTAIPRHPSAEWVAPFGRLLVFSAPPALSILAISHAVSRPGTAEVLTAAVAVALSGLAIVLFLRFVERDRRRRQVLVEHGDQPWRLRPDWSRLCSVDHSLAKSVAGGWAVVAVAGGMAALMAAFMWSGPISVLGWFVAWPIVLLVASLAITVAIRTLRLVTDGVALLDLDEAPVVPGRTVGGEIRVPRRLEPGSLRLRLECVREKFGVPVNAGRERAAERRRVLYQEDLTPADKPQQGRPGTSVPVNIPVPNGQGVTWRGGVEAVSWHLAIEARLMRWGLPYSADFQLPVYDAKPKDVMRRGASGEDGP